MDFNADDLETYYNITTSSLYSYGDQDANTVPLPYHEAPDPGVRQEALTNQQVSVHPDVCTPHDPMIQELHTSREVSDLFRHSALKQMSWSTQPNEAGWERYKPRIEQLYKDNTLTEVMAIMKREHGLPISTKMYKDRIGKWGFNKNIKSKKMEAIVRKQVQRSRSGKKSAFCLCNHPVSEHKIRRYRTRFKLLSDEQALTLRAKTPPDLVCYTPLASPMTTPRELETPELIAKLIQEYISGSFYSKMWVIGDGEGCTSTKNPTTSIFDFYDLSNNALTYFGWGEVRRAYQLLDMAVALIRPMLSDQDPQFLRIFFFTLRNLICDSRLGPISNEIALMLLRHFSEMSSVVIGPQHPFSRMFPRLMGLEISMLKHVFSIAHQCQLEGFAKRLGRFSRTMMPFLIERYWDTDHSQSLEHFLALLAELEHALGPSDLRCLRVRLYLAASYFRCEQYGEMAEMAQSVITTALTVQADSLRFAAFHHLSEAQFGLSQFGLAEQNIRQAIYIQAKIYGWEDENVLYLMSHLASWLKGWDRHDEAAEIDRHVQISTDTKYEKLRRKEEEEYQRCLASK